MGKGCTDLNKVGLRYHFKRSMKGSASGEVEFTARGISRESRPEPEQKRQGHRGNVCGAKDAR